MADIVKKKTRNRPRPARGVAFTIWSANGGQIPDAIIRDIEAAIEGTTLVAFNDGHRLLTQTTRG